MEWNKAEQSRAEQSRAEQSRAEQSRAEQSRAEQSRAEQIRAVQTITIQIRADQNDRLNCTLRSKNGRIQDPIIENLRSKILYLNKIRRRPLAHRIHSLSLGCLSQWSVLAPDIFYYASSPQYGLCETPGSVWGKMRNIVEICFG
jgi:hypothetical protein